MATKSSKIQGIAKQVTNLANKADKAISKGNRESARELLDRLVDLKIDKKTIVSAINALPWAAALKAVNCLVQGFKTEAEYDINVVDAESDPIIYDGVKGLSTLLTLIGFSKFRQQDLLWFDLADGQALYRFDTMDELLTASCHTPTATVCTYRRILKGYVKQLNEKTGLIEDKRVMQLEVLPLGKVINGKRCYLPQDVVLSILARYADEVSKFNKPINGSVRKGNAKGIKSGDFGYFTGSFDAYTKGVVKARLDSSFAAWADEDGKRFVETRHTETETPAVEQSAEQTQTAAPVESAKQTETETPAESAKQTRGQRKPRQSAKQTRAASNARGTRQGSNRRVLGVG